jgi:hypothetical protein
MSFIAESHPLPPIPDILEDIPPEQLPISHSSLDILASADTSALDEESLLPSKLPADVPTQEEVDRKSSSASMLSVNETLSDSSSQQCSRKSGESGRHSPKQCSTPKRSSSLARQMNACSHVTLTRQHGDEVCHICHREPVLKWVYRCVQDLSKHVYKTPREAQDIVNSMVSDAKMVRNYLEVEDDQKLSSQDGYTPRQRDIVRLQQLRVIDTISHFQWANQDPEEHDVYESSISINDDFFSKAAELLDFLDGCSKILIPRFHPCDFAVCHGCYPLICQRGWESMDALANDYPNALVQSYPRVSDVALVKKILFTK